MKNATIALSLLLGTAGLASARGQGGQGGHGGRAGGFSSRGHFSRPLSRPTFAHRTTSARPSSAGAAARTGFLAASAGKGGSTFAGQMSGAKAATAGTPGGGASGGGTGGTAAGGSSGGGTSAPAVVTEQGGWATPGSKILTAGQQPVYSTPSGGGTFSVDGGGFVAINQGQAGDVGRGPGMTWGPRDTPPSSGSGSGSGTGATPNGPAFNPAF